MTLDEILASLFPDGHDVQERRAACCLGSAHAAIRRPGARHRCRGPDRRRRRRGHPPFRLRPGVLEQGSGPILVLVDSDSQRMSKRDELLGLNEFLAHLAKVPDLCGHAWPADHRPSVRPLGRRGASLRRGWQPACWWDCRAPTPAVMDLPSMAKVTKLSIERPAGEGEVDAGVRAGPVQSRPDGRRSRDLERRRLARRPVGGAAGRHAGCARPAGCARQGAWRPVEGRRNCGARP